jgi:hypothetical protein
MARIWLNCPAIDLAGRGGSTHDPADPFAAKDRS